MKKILIIAIALMASFSAGAQQLYNMSFDTWYKDGGVWCLYPAKAGDDFRVWDSVNRGVKMLGVCLAEPEYEHVAVPGNGKAAVKLSSHKFAGGYIPANLFTGRYVRTVKLSGIEMYNGVPFTGRPVSLSGYYHYAPGTIDCVKDPYKSKKGQQDNAYIEIALYTWDEPLHMITTDGPAPDPEKDPELVGRAVLRITKATDGYVHFEMPIQYRSAAVPTYIGISITPSAWGEFLTGSSKSVLYVDELKFNY